MILTPARAESWVGGRGFLNHLATAREPPGPDLEEVRDSVVLTLFISTATLTYVT